MSKVAITLLAVSVWSSFCSVVFSIPPGNLNYVNLTPEEAAEVVKEYIGSDKSFVIGTLATREYAGRKEIADVYKQKYGKDLVEELKDAFSGDAKKAMIAIMTPPMDYIASEVHAAVDGPGTDEEALIELLLCARTNEEMRQIKEAYKRLYGVSMEEDVKDDTSGGFEAILELAMKAERSEAPADEEKAAISADALWYASEETFIQVLLKESYQQIFHISLEYNVIARHTLEHGIDMQTSGDVQEALTTIVTCAKNTPFYFASKIHKAVKGLGTDEDALIRILVSRFESDLLTIKSIYPADFRESLESAIYGDTYNSGYFSEILLALIRRY